MSDQKFTLEMEIAIKKHPTLSYDQHKFPVSRYIFVNNYRWIMGTIVTAYRKHIIKEFFVLSESPGKWWLCGLLLADGCVIKGKSPQAMLTLQLCDESLAVKSLNVIPVEHLSVGRYRHAVGGFPTRDIFVWSTAICPLTERFLSFLSIFPRKTGKEFFPPISDVALPHWLRGLIDGDGSFHVGGGGTMRTSIASMSQAFLLQLHNRLHDTGVVRGGGVYKAGSIFQLQYAGYDTESLRRFIYPEDLDENICLLRKKNRFNEFIQSMSPTRRMCSLAQSLVRMSPTQFDKFKVLLAQKRCAKNESK